MMEPIMQPIIYQATVPPTVHAPVPDSKAIHEEIDELHKKAQQHAELIQKLTAEIKEIKEQLNK